MSEVLDEKVVSMRFDNKDFEKNAEESLSTIQKLKAALNFKDAAKNLDEISKASHKVDFSAVSSSIDSIASKFSVMEYAAFSAIQNITNKFVNAAEQWVKSVTIDPVSQGFGVYENKINSTMTILNNTGKSLRETNKILDELNEYSDKTIFSLNDMTTALGKFTAQGVDAAEAVEIIKGAANEAATMGAGSAEFSRMIYNLTQAYGMGSMKRIDFQSMENANIAGKEFKEQIIKAAIEVGTLDKEGRTLDKHIKVTASNFRDYLSTGFMSAEVMTKVFKDYASETSELGKKANDAAKNVKTFHQLLDVLGESVASTWSKSFSYIFGNFYEAKQLWTNISVIFDETVGKMNAARNELLKGWYEGFIDPAKVASVSVNELKESLESGLGDPRVVSGRTLLLDGFANILQSILQIVKPLKEAFREFFPATTAKSLWEMTKNFRDFTAHLKLSEGAIRELKDAFRGVFAIMSFARNVFKDFIHALIPASKNTESLFVIFLKLAGAVGRLIVKVTEGIRSSGAYRDTLASISYVLSTLVKIIVFAVVNLAKLVKAAADTGVLQAIFNGIANALNVVMRLLVRLGPVAIVIFKGIAAVAGALFLIIGNIVEFIENIFTSLFGGAAAENAGGNLVAGLAQGILNGAKGVVGAIVTVAKAIYTAFCTVFQIHSPSLVFFALGGFIIAGLAAGILAGVVKLDKVAEFVKAALSKIGDVGRYLKECAKGVDRPVQAMAATVEDANEKIGESSEGLMTKIGGWIRSLIGKLKELNIATVLVIGVITGLVVTFVKIASAFYNLGKGFRDGFKAVRNVTTGFKNVTKAFKRMHSPLVETLKGITLCVVGIAASLWLLSTLNDSGKLAGPLIALVGTMEAVLLFASLAAKYLQKYDLEDEMKTVALTILSVAGLIALMAIAFGTVMDTVKDLNGNWEPLWQSLAVLGAMAVIMIGVAIAVNRFSKEGSVKALLSMLIWTLSFSRVINALRDLVAVGKGIDSSNLEGLWLGAILPTFAIMMGIALMGAGFKNTGVGSALTVLVMVSAIKQIIAALGDLEISIDPALLEYLNSKVTTLKDVMVAIGAALLVISTIILVLLGDKINALGKGVLKIVIALGLLALLAKMVEKLNISKKAMAQTAMLTVFIGGLLLAVGGMAKMSRRSLNIGDFKGIIMSVALAVASMALLANVMKNLDGTSIGGLLLTIAVMFIGLYFVIDQMKEMKGVSTGPVLSLVGVILVISGAIIILSTLKDDIKYAFAGAVAIGIVLAALALAINQMKNMKAITAGPLIAMVLSLGIIVVGLMVLANKDMGKLAVATLALGGVLLALAFSMKMMENLKPDSVSSALVAVISVLAIGAMLGLLAQYDWDKLLGAAGAMGLTLLALAVAMKIMSGLSKGTTSILDSSLALVIAASSLIIMAYALKQFELIEWPVLAQAGLALLGITAALAILGAIGPEVALGAMGLLIGVASLIVLAEAIRQLSEVDISVLSQITEPLLYLAMIMTIAIAALPGAIAFVVLAASLIVLGNAMAVIASSGMNVSVLNDIAGSLMLMAIAGILLSAGAVGLMMGGIGLTILGLALKLFTNVPEGFGSILSGIAGGLMLFGVAGIVLAIGAAGLVAGGIGLMIIGAGLKIIQGVTIDAKRISDLADSITDLAIAGIISDFGGDGLITLGQGLMYIAQALAILNTLSLQILSISLPGLAEDSAKIGVYIVKGAEQGILKEYPTLLKMVAQLGTGMTQVMCRVLDIHSPSGIFKKIGLWILQGLGIGVTDATMTSGLEDAMKGLATDMLSSFTGTLGDGFDKIGNMFEDFNKKTKKWVKTGGHYEYGRGWVEEGYYKEVGMFEDMLNFDEMSKSFSSLFDSSGFEGASDLSKIFENLKNDEIDLDFSTGNLTDSLAGLSSGLGETSGATKGLTKEMTGSLDVFAEFDRKVSKTSAEIKKNLLTNMVSDNEYREMINDLMVAGFDQDFIKTQITDKGKKEGYEIASAILAEYNSGNGEAVKDWYNKQWRASKGNNVGLDATIALLGLDEKQYDKALKGLDWSDANYAIHGNLVGLADGFDTANLHVKNSSKETGKAVQETYEELGKLNDGVKTAKENADRYQQAISKDDENAATIAVENLSEVIMRAIDTYMPAESFVRLGKNICLGLATGIWSYTYLAEKAIGMSASDLIDLFANKIKSHSPSEVFKDFGEYMMEGLAIGIKDTNDPEQATNKMADDLISHYRMIMNQIIAIMNSDEEWQPTIRPVVDFSNLQASTGALQTMFDGTQVSLAGKDFSSFKASLAPSGNGLISMSKDEMRQLLAGFADEIVRGVNNGEKNVDVQVSLEGDAKGIFKLVRDENNQYKRTAGYSAFV